MYNPTRKQSTSTALMQRFSFVFMLMMHIRKMRMRMCHWRMFVRMTVFNVGAYRNVMFMLMVCIMDMLMFMRQLLMGVFMLMVLSQVQPDPQRH